jgi:hypothetical protein
MDMSGYICGAKSGTLAFAAFAAFAAAAAAAAAAHARVLAELLHQPLLQWPLLPMFQSLRPLPLA